MFQSISQTHTSYTYGALGVVRLTRFHHLSKLQTILSALSEIMHVPVGLKFAAGVTSGRR